MTRSSQRFLTVSSGTPANSAIFLRGTFSPVRTEILGILTKLGYRDKRMQEAVDLVISKQDDQGRWKLENAFNGRFQVDFEQKGKPSKWITLNALKALKGFYG